MKHLTELAVFAAVVDAGNFTRAARRLGVSKASVSSQVSRLEAELGTRLLNRSTRSLALTAAGEAALDHCRKMVAEAESARAAAREMHGEPVGTLRVACPETFAEMYVAPLCAGFLAAYPRLSVELSGAPWHVDLIGERFDLAIRIGDLPDSALTARRFARARLLVVAAPAFLERLGPIMQAADLEGADILQFTPFGWGDRWQLRDSEDVPHRVTGRVRLSSDSGAALRAAALAGIGLALLPDWMVREELASGELIEVMPGWGRRDIPIHAIHAGDRRSSAKVRAFVDWLVRQASPQPTG